MRVAVRCLGIALLGLSALFWGQALAQRSAAKPDLPSRVPPSRPLLKINGQLVTVGQYVDRLSLRYGVAVRESLVDDILISQEAKRRKMVISQKDIRAAAEATLKQAVARFGGEQQLAKDLMTNRGWTLDQYRYVLRGDALRQIRLNRISDQLLKGYQPSEDEVRAEYKQNGAAYSRPARVRITHLLVRMPKSADAELQKSVHKRAELLLKEIVAAKGANLETLAKENSDDAATKKLGGKFPVFLQRGSTPYGAAFDEIVFNAPEGLIPRLIKSTQGFHIVRVDEREAERTLKLEEVRQQIISALRQRERQERLTALITKLRLTAHVQQFQRF